MVTASLISRLSQAVDQVVRRLQQNRPFKVAKVRCGLDEDRDAARDRHYAAHPEDRGADVVIFRFLMGERRVRARMAPRAQTTEFKDRGPRRF
jgi:hypothetical protein